MPDETTFNTAREALSMLIDGAYRQIEANHKRPDGNFDDELKMAYNELFAHLREELDARDMTGIDD